MKDAAVDKASSMKATVMDKADAVKAKAQDMKASAKVKADELIEEKPAVRVDDSSVAPGSPFDKDHDQGL